MSIVALALRTYVRYLVPLTVLAVIACAPIVWFALGATEPRDAASARAMLRVTFVIAATAWVWQIMLAGAAAELVDGVATRTPISSRQPRRSPSGASRSWCPGSCSWCCSR